MSALDELHTHWPLPWRFGLAGVIFLAALLLRFAILPVDAGLVYLTFYWCVLAAFYLCGPGPGRLTIALSAVAGYYFFSPPYGTFVFNQNGVVSAIVFVITSSLIGAVITKLQKTTARMRSAITALGLNEQRYHGIIEDQTDLICRFQADGTVLYVNDAFCRYFGRSKEDVLRGDWRPYVSPEDVANVERQLATLSPQNQVTVIEHRVPATDGSVRWAQFVNRAFFDGDGQLIEMQSVGRDITDRKALEDRLAASLAELRDIYDYTPCAYYSLSPDGTILHMNETGLAWLGRAREEVIGKLKLPDVLTAEGQAQFRDTFPKFKANGVVRNLPFDLVSRNGEVRRVSVSATALTDADGAFLMSRSAMYDITELTETRNALRQLTQEQNAMLDNDMVGILKLHDRRMVWVNKAIYRIFGYEGSELDGQSTRILYEDGRTFETVSVNAYDGNGIDGVFRTQMEMVRKDGEKLWIDASGTRLSTGNSDWLWIFVDITPLRKYQEAAEYMALHDDLTGLPNRRLLNDRLSQAIVLARRTQRHLVLCYIDLDGFKPVNDRRGHAAGDRLLREVASRLQACVRENDTVCRLGGDEFVLMLTNLEHVAEHEAIVERAKSELCRPIVIDAGVEATVSASIGVAIFPDDADEPDALLCRADDAMYQAKALGRNCICRYHPVAKSPAPDTAATAER
jgi:diguanylate cyclase (GGDEF)-like protein/PAS domain S-box-containing protein